MIKFVLLIWSVGLCTCEDPGTPWRIAFYPNSIPRGEYGAPPLPTSSVEISRENIELAGHLVEINNAQSPGYPSSHAPYHFRRPKLSSVVFLPKETSASSFLPNESPAQPFRSSLLTGEVFPSQRQSSRLINQQKNFGSQTQSHSQAIKQPNPSLSTEYGAPPNSYEPPQNSYSPPSNPYPYPYPSAVPSTPTPPPPPPPAVHEVVTETPVANDDDEENTTDPTVIAVANASGQYYLLGKDNTLQRVVYETVRNKDDKKQNGFTARLRYEPVEPIRDPIYGYDEFGHLVRIYNKK